MNDSVKAGIRFCGLCAVGAALFGGILTMGQQSEAAKKRPLRIRNAGKSLLINKRETKRLKTNRGATWKSSKKKVVSVNRKGVIRGRRYGTAVITATAKDGSRKKARVKVQVGRKVKKISVAERNLRLAVGKKGSVKSSVSPSNATRKKVSYISSNKKVATVSSGGTVTAKGEGNATISIKSTDGSGKKAYCKVQVHIPTSRIELSTNSANNRLEMGKSMSVLASVYPTNATNSKVRYTSLNPDIVTVSNVGVVSGVKPGTATIRVDAEDGNATATLVVEVYKMEVKGQKLIAHRGLSSEAPENTTEAFRLAVDAGFYGVECDIRKTLDDEFVVSHNADLKSSCGVDFTIANLGLLQIKEYDIISGNHVDKYPNLKIPTLEEYLEIMATSDTVHPFIELKEEHTVADLQRIVDMVNDYGVLDRTYFISMHQSNLLALQNIKGVQKQYLQYIYGVYETVNVPNDVLDWCIQHSIDLDARHTLISEDEIKKLQQAGRKVNVWTVKTLREAYELVTRYQVDMITTDYRLDTQ